MKTLKKILYFILFAIVSILLFLGYQTYKHPNTTSWSWLTSIGSEKVKSKQSQVQMNGKNGRIYGFDYQDPNTKGWKHCVQISTDGGSGGMSCWESRKPKK